MQNYTVCNSKIFKYLLFPFSLLFRMLVALRRAFYRYGIFSVTRIDVPVIIVGNITVGGTGKTPLVIRLVQLLQQHGYQPGIVSRGYGGRGTNYPSLVTADSNPLQTGDETVLIARRTGCPVVIDPDRANAAKFLLKQYPSCNVIISDDGLQHYALGRDIEIAVIDGERRFGNALCLPAGPLREPISRLKSVDFIVTNGHVETDEYSMTLLPDVLHSLDNPSVTEPVIAFTNKTLHAVAGIGNPQRFFNMLRELGLTIIEHPFPDHHVFKEKDLSFGPDELIVMTEKDAVKCQKLHLKNSWYVPVNASLSADFEKAFISKLEKSRIFP